MPRYTQTTAPIGEPVELADIVQQVRFVDAPDRTYANGLITKARRYVETRLQRQLLTASWSMYLDGFPEEIEVRRLPVLTVASITYVDTAGDTQTLSSSLYQTDLACPDAPGRIKPAYGEAWPSTRSGDYNAVTVAFTAGYGTDAEDVPETIRHAIMMLVAWWFDQREPVSIGGVVNPLPFTVQSLIDAESWGVYA